MYLSMLSYVLMSLNDPMFVNQLDWPKNPPQRSDSIVYLHESRFFQQSKLYQGVNFFVANGIEYRVGDFLMCLVEEAEFICRIELLDYTSPSVANLSRLTVEEIRDLPIHRISELAVLVRKFVKIDGSERTREIICTSAVAWISPESVLAKTTVLSKQQVDELSALERRQVWFCQTQRDHNGNDSPWSPRVVKWCYKEIQSGELILYFATLIRFYSVYSILFCSYFLYCIFGVNKTS